MNRRDLVAATALSLLAPSLPLSARSGQHVEYTPSAFDKAVDSGQPLLLDFYAPW